MKFTALLCLLLTGCAGWPTEQTEFIHVNTHAEALKIAAAWRAESPQHTSSTAGFTGSMVPVIYGGDIVLLEYYTGQPVRAGQIVVYDRGDTPNVLHRLLVVKRNQALLSGDANFKNDGWHPLTAIKFVVPRVVSWPH